MPRPMASEDVGRRRRVAIDGTSLLGPRTGIGHLTAELIGALAAGGEIDVSTYAISRTGRRDLAPHVPAGVHIGAAPLPARYVFPLWERGWGPRIERWTGRIDLVHATNYRPPPARATVMASVHDLSFVRQPELVDEETRRFGTRLVQLAIDRGAYVHVISDFVGAEVREHYGLPPERVVRVHPGIVDMAGGDPAAGRRDAGADRYLLALGQVEPRKNFPRLVQAFDAMAGTSSRPCARARRTGRMGPGELRARASRRGSGRQSSAVARLRHRPRPARSPGRRHRLRVPVALRGLRPPPARGDVGGRAGRRGRRGAIPEAVGDAALLVDPSDVDALSAALTAVVGDEDVRDRLVAAGRRRAAGFTWTRAAAELTAAYRRLTPDV